MRNALLLLAVLVGGAGCGKKANPLYCEDSPDKQCGSPTDAAAPDMASPPCKSSSECPATNPLCDGTKCTSCTTLVAADAGASDGGASDGGTATGVCAMFHGSTPLCGPSGACVECVAKEDCASSQKTCDTSQGKCGPCKVNGDCATGVCLSGGMCAAKGTVAFVDNRGMSPSVCQAANPSVDGSTPANAYCDVQDAITGTMKPYVVVKGSAAPYGGVTISAGGSTTIAIFGPGRGASPTAKIAGNMAPGVSLTGTSGAVALTIDGFDVTANVLGDAVKCGKVSGAATIVVRNSLVHSATGVGVKVADCDVTLDANDIRGNTGGGVTVDGVSRYAITNNFIVENGGANGGGVSLGNAASGVFAWNTVARNTYGFGAAGISCGTGSTKLLESSIVVENTPAAGSQFAGSCAFANVVVGTDGAMTGTVQLSPEFVQDAMAPGDYHLKSGSSKNTDCCVDKVQPGTSDAGAMTLTDHDVDLSRRPVGRGWDIGAHELQ